MNNASVIFLILGSIIGAGFATGKEIYVFYANYGVVGLFGATISIFLFYYIILKYLTIKKLPNTKSIKVLDFVVVLCMLIVASALFGAANEFKILKITLSYSIIGLFVLIITILVLLSGLNGFSKFSTIFVPVMIFVFVVTNICGIVVNIPQGITNPFNNNVLVAMFKCVSYVGINTMLSSKLIIDAGGNVTKPKFVSLCVSLLLCIIIIISTICLIYFNGTNDVSMPLVEVAYSINGVVGNMYLIVLFISIITSLMGVLYAISKFINVYIKNKTVSIILSVLISYVISFSGFSSLINYCYPIIGVVGIIYFVVISKFAIKSECINIQNNK